MKFSKGERVIDKTTGVEVEVVKSLSTKIIEVAQGDKIFPVHCRQLKPLTLEEEIANSKVTLEKKKTAKPETTSRQKTENKFCLLVTPIYDACDEEVIKELRLSFINRSGQQVVFEYNCSIKNKTTFEIKEVIGVEQNKLMLHDLNLSKMSHLPIFSFTIKSLKGKVDGQRNNGIFIREMIKLKPKKLFSYLSKMGKENRSDFEIEISKRVSYHRRQKSTGTVKRKSDSKLKRKKQPSVHISKWEQTNEIDIHAESLAIKTKNLDNFEILTRQLNATEEAIDRALARGQKSLIIIHGVGNGKLKEEVHRILKAHPAVWFNQSSSWRPDYGYGATEVFFN